MSDCVRVEGAGAQRHGERGGGHTVKGEPGKDDRSATVAHQAAAQGAALLALTGLVQRQWTLFGGLVL